MLVESLITTLRSAASIKDGLWGTHSFNRLSHTVYCKKKSVNLYFQKYNCMSSSQRTRLRSCQAIQGLNAHRNALSDVKRLPMRGTPHACLEAS